MTLDWETEMMPLIRSNFFNEFPPFKFSGDKKSGFNGNMTDEIYIVWDSLKVGEDLETNCVEFGMGGTVVCDIDGDGDVDITEGGERSWLCLEQVGNPAGGCSQSDLGDWLRDGLATPLAIHTWLSGNANGIGNAYSVIADEVMATYSNPYKFATLPVFNDICPANPFLEPLCASKIHPEDVVVENGKADYFHIIGFSAFYTTCVGTSDPKSICPAREAFLAANPSIKSNDLKSVEGYFVSGAPVTIGPGGTGGADIGVYVVSLTR